MKRCDLSRRRSLASLLTLAASPLAPLARAQETSLDDLINVHEFEDFCKK